MALSFDLKSIYLNNFSETHTHSIYSLSDKTASILRAHLNVIYSSLTNIASFITLK